MSQLGQAQTPAEHGSFLHESSVGGGKIEFVLDSDLATTSFTLSASGNASNLDFFTIRDNLSIYDSGGNLIRFGELIAWNYTFWYVDARDSLYQYRTGPSANGTTAALRKLMNINMSTNNQLLAETDGLSHQTIYYFQNNDSSSHVIYGDFFWKYLKT